MREVPDLMREVSDLTGEVSNLFHGVPDLMREVPDLVDGVLDPSREVAHLIDQVRMPTREVGDLIDQVPMSTRELHGPRRWGAGRHARGAVDGSAWRNKQWARRRMDAGTGTSHRIDRSHPDSSLRDAPPLPGARGSIHRDRPFLPHPTEKERPAEWRAPPVLAARNQYFTRKVTP